MGLRSHGLPAAPCVICAAGRPARPWRPAVAVGAVAWRLGGRVLRKEVLFDLAALR